MKPHHPILTCLSLLAAPAFAQQPPQGYADPQNIRVVESLEPHYPGGEEKLFQYIRYHIKYPEAAKGKVIEGEIVAKFNVEPDSTLTGIVIVGGVGNGVDEEVKRILAGIKYAPSVQNGMRVRTNVMINMPLRVRVE